MNFKFIEQPALSYIPQKKEKKPSEEEIKKFIQYIQNSLKSINSKYNPEVFKQKALIILGSIGVGKSTLIHFLLKNKLRFVDHDGRYMVEACDQKDPIIGKDPIAQTSFPYPYHLNKEDFNAWDTPGFKDTGESKIELLNAISIKSLFKKLQGEIKWQMFCYRRKKAKGFYC